MRCWYSQYHILKNSIKETATPYLGFVQDFKEGGNTLRGNCKPGFPGLKGRKNSDLSGSHVSLKHRLMI